MIIAFILAAVLCTPMHPSPTMHWDSVQPFAEDLKGYKIYWKYSDEGNESWTLLKDLPCWDYEVYTCQTDNVPDDLCSDWVISEILKICRGEAGTTTIPPHRYHSAEETEIDFCVKSYDFANNESINCSNDLLICMPKIWPGPPYPYN